LRQGDDEDSRVMTNLMSDIQSGFVHRRLPDGGFKVREHFVGWLVGVVQGSFTLLDHLMKIATNFLSCSLTCQDTWVVVGSTYVINSTHVEMLNFQLVHEKMLEKNEKIL
jgi:hypothetical protein